MLRIHHLGRSQSDRIVWLCEELEIPYELVRYERDAVTMLAPPEYKALHPSGTAPVIEDGPLLLGESTAIIEYIIYKYGSGRLAVRSHESNFPEYLYWYHFANSTMMPAGSISMVVNFLGEGSNSDNETMRSLKSRWTHAFALTEARLSKASYFAGDIFTAADIVMQFPLTTMRYFVPYDISGYPHILSYLRRIADRSAFKRAFQKCDPDLQLKLA